MSDIIKAFYEKTSIIPALMQQKLNRFNENPDIKEEFEYWIKEKKYKESDAVSLQGYTAKKLSELSPYMQGEGAFVVLMELRDNPDKALKRIKEGFKKK